MNGEITHAFGGMVGNGVYVTVCMYTKETRLSLSTRERVTSIYPRDIPDLIISGEAP